MKVQTNSEINFGACKLPRTENITTMQGYIPSLLQQYSVEIKAAEKTNSQHKPEQKQTKPKKKMPPIWVPMYQRKMYKLGDLKDGIRQIDADSVYDDYIKGETKTKSPLDIAMENKVLESTNQTMNGEINEFMQGPRGDCYLLSSLYSIYSTKNGKETLKKNIEYNKDGSVTVTLPGAIKAKNSYEKDGDNDKCLISGKYHITKEAIEKAKNLAGKTYAYGDLDVIVTELAYEAYNAEVNITNYAMGQPKCPFVPGQDCGGNRHDALSNGKIYDAIYILTGKQSEMFQADKERQKSIKPYCKGEYSTKKNKGISASYLKTNKFIPERTIEKEVSTLYSKDSELHKMIEKYKGQEDKYAITVGFICGVKMPNGKCLKIGGHALSVTKITDDFVEVANPHNTKEKERIPRADFEQMVNRFVVAEM